MKRLDVRLWHCVQRLTVALSLGALLLCAGCGRSDLGRVSGTVTMDGEPVEGVTVTFMPNGGGGVSFGTTDSNGEYTLTHFSGSRGAVIATHSVSIEVDEDDEENWDSEGYEEEPEEAEDEPVERRIPERYNDETELTAEVSAGDNPIDFTLTSSEDE
jgi:hypothetical protein